MPTSRTAPANRFCRLAKLQHAVTMLSLVCCICTVALLVTVVLLIATDLGAVWMLPPVALALAGVILLLVNRLAAITGHT